MECKSREKGAPNFRAVGTKKVSYVIDLSGKNDDDVKKSSITMML